jgi:dihydrodipicolinate synthase/N-acetylneuraminate lyase
MEIAGTGVPLVTPFDESGALDRDALEGVVGHVAPHVDFLVPCGSTGEAPFLSDEEHARVVETVADATDLPVLAGVDGPGLRGAVDRARRAATAGADAVLAVTPYYYDHGPTDLAAYYRDLAAASPLPVFCYSVPKLTGVALEPETVAGVAEHDAVAGIKDSSGDVGRIGRTARATPASFATLVGAGGVYAHALDAGADGGILALANAVPELVAAVYDRHERGDERAARALNADLVALNRALTARHGVPALKAVLRERGVPAGRPRRPLGPADEDAVAETLALLESALDRDP